MGIVSRNHDLAKTTGKTNYNQRSFVNVQISVKEHGAIVTLI